MPRVNYLGSDVLKACVIDVLLCRTFDIRSSAQCIVYQNSLDKPWEIQSPREVQYQCYVCHETQQVIHQN